MNENKIACHQLLCSISEYIDGELDPALCEELERHLCECEDCQIVLDTTRKTINLYHTTSEEEGVPTDVRQRLFKCLNLEDYIQRKSAAPEGSEATEVKGG
jgi:anti-sigma factor RsiW